MRDKRRLAIPALVLIAIAVGAAVSTWLLAGGGEQLAQPASAGQIRWTVDDARQFQDFPLYWLGENYEGLPLTRILRYRYEPSSPEELAIQERFSVNLGEDIVLFIYGSCTPGPEDDTGCAPPLSIRVEPYCMRPPELLAGEAKAAPPQSVRGVQSQDIGHGDIILWPGDVRVSLFARDAMVADAAASSLAAVSPNGPQAGDPLPPADPSGCSGP